MVSSDKWMSNWLQLQQTSPLVPLPTRLEETPGAVLPTDGTQEVHGDVFLGTGAHDARGLHVPPDPSELPPLTAAGCFLMFRGKAGLLRPLGLLWLMSSSHQELSGKKPEFVCKSLQEGGFQNERVPCSSKCLQTKFSFCFS